MKARNETDVAVIYVIGAVFALAVLLSGIAEMRGDTSGKGIVLVVVAGVIGMGIAAWARAFGARRTARAELSSGEEYRALADEYRRLADLAITAQEHTDLKLGDVGVQLDYLRDQMESMQKILKEVE